MGQYVGKYGQGQFEALYGEWWLEGYRCLVMGQHEGKYGQGRFEVLRVCDKWQIEGYPDKVQHEVESGD